MNDEYVFPQDRLIDVNYGDPFESGKPLINKQMIRQGGLTLRDYFAAQFIPVASLAIAQKLTLSKLLESPMSSLDYNMIALEAYIMADAMLKAREK